MVRDWESRYTPLPLTTDREERDRSQAGLFWTCERELGVEIRVRGSQCRLQIASSIRSAVESECCVRGACAWGALSKYNPQI